MSLSNLFVDLLVHRIHSISELNNEDYVNLVGHYNHALAGGRDEIDPTLLSRGYTPEVLAATKKKVSIAPITSCGLKFTKHLSHFKYPLFGYVLSLYENYERGQLPFDGSVSDQPAQVMDIFSVISNIRFEQQKKQLEKVKQHGRHQRKDSARTR